MEMTVHGAHCCKDCGCKYGDEDCPVVLGTEDARYDCEDCVNNPVKVLLDALHEISAIEDQEDGGDWDEIDNARDIANIALDKYKNFYK